jgi:PilZ domain-containing protein
MIELPQPPVLAGRLAALARDIQARILNYSPSGCLLETNVRLDVGTIGRVRFVIDGRELADDVQVMRCQAIEGAGSLYQVGARFLWTIAPGKGTVRHALGLTQTPAESVAEERIPG